MWLSKAATNQKDASSEDVKATEPSLATLYPPSRVGESLPDIDGSKIISEEDEARRRAAKAGSKSMLLLAH